MIYYNFINEYGIHELCYQIKEEFLFQSCDVKFDHDINTYTNKRLFRITFHTGNIAIDKYLVLEFVENDENLYIGSNPFMIKRKDFDRIFKYLHRKCVIDNINK